MNRKQMVSIILFMVLLVCSACSNLEPILSSKSTIETKTTQMASFPVASNNDSFTEPITSETGSTEQSEIYTMEPISTISESSVIESLTRDVLIDETILLEKDGVKITALSIEEDWLGTVVKMLIENKSGQDLVVVTQNESINGFAINGYMNIGRHAVTIADGKKANYELLFYEDDLNRCRIDAMAEIEFSFWAMNEKDYKTFYNQIQSL